MVIFEIEDHTTGIKAFCEAESIEEMHTALIEKGFEVMAYSEWYALISDKGHEISAMPIVCPNVKHLQNFKSNKLCVPVVK